MILHVLGDSLFNSILITGLVTMMMMMIESLNIKSKGRFLSAMGRSRVGGVLAGTLLGLLPGCLGGFATVSLYTHGMLSFGSLVAMMIASAGDEAFVMLATIPGDSLWIFALLAGIAVITGVVTDFFVKPSGGMRCASYEVHDEDIVPESHDNRRHWGWKRVVMFAGVAVFIVALVTGHLEHGHEGAAADGHSSGELAGGINLLDEEWMNVLFGVLSLTMLAVLARASDHFVDEHLWNHVVRRHLPVVFAWTFGTLAAVGILLNFFDISAWISDNVALMILLAAAIGFIPESGPHLLFVMLYASGAVPLPVLLASCISQDGHASLPLLAESKKSFLKAKLINCAVALAIGFAAMLIL